MDVLKTGLGIVSILYPTDSTVLLVVEKDLFCAQAGSIDIFFIEWMLPFWIPFETNIHFYFSIKY